MCIKKSLKEAKLLTLEAKIIVLDLLDAPMDTHTKEKLLELYRLLK